MLALRVQLVVFWGGVGGVDGAGVSRREGRGYGGVERSGMARTLSWSCVSDCEL